MNLIKYLCDGVIESIDNRVRAICEKYESRLQDYKRADIVGCTLILAGQIAETLPGDEYRDTFNPDWNEASNRARALMPRAPAVVRSGLIAMRFELPSHGWLTKTTTPDAPFRPEYWFLLGPESCFVQKLLLANVNLSVGEGAGNFGKILGPTLQCQHKITAEVRHAS